MKTLLFASFLLGSVLLYNCQKSSTPVNVSHLSYLKVHLVDAPSVTYGEVNINVIGVELQMANGNTIDLNVQPKIVNLLNFVNGKDTILTTDTIQPGEISQIRLMLGSGNTVKIGDLVYPLSTPSANESGLKLVLNKPLVAGVSYDLILDFDAGQSIVTTGNGGLQLKPVIRVVDYALSGSISGSISNLSELPCLVEATDGTNTYSTITDHQGNFIMNAVPAGSYSVMITPPPPLQGKTLSNVNVTVGNQTNLGVITF